MICVPRHTLYGFRTVITTYHLRFVVITDSDYVCLEDLKTYHVLLRNRSLTVTGDVCSNLGTVVIENKLLQNKHTSDTYDRARCNENKY